MIRKITQNNIGDVPCGSFRQYAGRYLKETDEFEGAIRKFGLAVAERPSDSDVENLARRVLSMQDRGLVVANDAKSFSLNWISPACLACRLGIGSKTFLSSTQCPHNCYFCFNPNQLDYDYYLSHVHDMASELSECARQGIRFDHLAVTGGEPLLHREQTIAFFEKARGLYPRAYTRLYTSGAGLDGECRDRLVEAGLDEIRFSIKLDEGEEFVEATLQQIRLCVGVLDAVVVEMPVMPDQVGQMKELLLRLEDIGIAGVNLLELCFPLRNAEAFAERGYKIKHEPYRVPYDYWYAGGLPIEGSEEACFELLGFALDEGLSIGVHYCSLENKLTGQVYQQNRQIPSGCICSEMSKYDFFLKSAKVFGSDREHAERALLALGETRIARDEKHGCLEFPLRRLPDMAMQLPDMPVAVSTCISEPGASSLRVLEVGITTPSTFDYEYDW